MPIVKRTVEPTHVSHGAIESNTRNELECVANNTMANIIRQLSSLSALAEDLFTELHRETCFVFQRSAQLDERIERLKIKVTQLNPTVEEVSLQDINMRKPFRSSVIKDQQIATFETRPLAIVAKYQECDAPPPLHKLNAYREDGKDSMKFYTDPGYFFELWCMEMAKDSEAQAKKHRHRKKARPTSQQRKTIRAPKSHVAELESKKHGVELADTLVRDHSKRQQQQDHVTSSRRPISTAQIDAKSPPLAGVSMVYPPRASEYGYILPNGNVSQPAVANQTPAYGHAAMRPESTISDSGYSSPRIMAGQDGNHAPFSSRMSGYASSSGSVTPGSRPAGPPPAPPATTVPVTTAANMAGYAHSAGKVTRPNVSATTASRMPSSVSRESLPPPPPTPQVQKLPPPVSEKTGRLSGGIVLTGVQQTPVRDSLPPPVTPPGNTSASMFDTSALPSPPSDLVMMMMPPIVPPPPPPPSPPPFDVSSPLPLPPDIADFDMIPPTVPPPPPPPIVELLAVPSSSSIAGSDSVQQDTVSECSESSSVATSSTKISTDPSGGGKVENLVRDTRSDLLSAIREGFKLRKVEERRIQTETSQLQKTPGHLDVQSIMEAAFERRRRALEENDSDHDGEDDPDGGDAWDDDG